MSFGRGARIWVPRPASLAYRDAGDPVSVRDSLVKEFGETTVTEAEISTILDVFIITGIMKSSEFIETITIRLKKIDQARRAAANLDSDRG